ncbi:MAG: Lacal_2735 family protein [Gammaproteobacteria bacterium]|nr:Lacal_2735 family protein [Gammaproteobacteria bacterium]
MFRNFFNKRSLAKLQKKYNKLMFEAMQAQRNGNIKEYSFITAEAETIAKQIEQDRSRL